MGVASYVQENFTIELLVVFELISKTGLDALSTRISGEVINRQLAAKFSAA